jgi:hypothetical protein
MTKLQVIDAILVAAVIAAGLGAFVLIAVFGR